MNSPVVTVVPIVRLRRATRGWSYTVPTSMRGLQVGALVIVPFRKRPTLGVVWDTEENSKATESVSEALTTTPLVRAAQRQLIEWIAESGITSLSSALYTWLPAALRGFPLTKSVREVLSQWDANQPDARTLALIRQHALLVPSHKPLAEAALRKKYGETFHNTFDDSTPAQEFATWVKIAQGAIHIVNGRERALYAPYCNVRHVTVIEPEDIAYYTEQTPFVSLTKGAEVLSFSAQANYEFKSNVPTQTAAELWPGATGQAAEPEIDLVDLRHARLINDHLLLQIRSALEHKKEVLLLYNAHDRLRNLEDGTKLVIPGIETVAKQLASALELSTLPPMVHLGTRHILHSLPPNLGFVAILSLDPLLHSTNLADQLHGWGDIGRLAQAGLPITIQTYNPQHPLVVSLSRQKFAEYCQSVIEEARANHLPPFSEHVACALPGDSSLAQTLYEQLTKSPQTTWKIAYPRSTNRRGKPVTVVSLYAAKGTRLPQDLFKILAALPRPWKVERNPWYAL